MIQRTWIPVGAFLIGAAASFQDAKAFGQCGEVGAGNCYAANGTPGCEGDPCCELVCPFDPFCCETEWDALCAIRAFDICSSCGFPTAGSCLEANGSRGCDHIPCCETVCAIDAYCCDDSWDAACAALAYDACLTGQDECDICFPVTDGTTSILFYTSNNSSVTGDDTSCALDDAIDEWFCYTATTTGTINATTCHADTNFDTTLAVFDTCGGNEIACNDETPGPALSACDSLDLGVNSASTVSWDAVSDVTYYLRVSGASGAVGDYRLTVEPAPVAVANDECSHALPIKCNSTVLGTTIEATVDDDTPSCGGAQTSPGVWYELIGNGQTITLSLCNVGTSFDTKIGVFTGGCDNLACIAGNDQFCGDQSQVTFKSLAEEVYSIEIHAFGGQTGDFELEVTCQTPDLSGDGNVDASDLAILLNAWGADHKHPADLDGNGTVGPGDLAVLLAAWGAV